MTIEKIRTEIDAVDKGMLELFLRRMELAGEIGAYKRENALPVRDKERERQLLYKLCKDASPELLGYVKALFSTLIEMSCGYQGAQQEYNSHVKELIENALANTPDAFPQRAIVACQGVEGAYSQLACDKLFSLPNIMYMRNFESIFKAVDSNLCDYGILPLENSSAGSVNEVYELMNHYRFYIIRSVKLPVAHALLAARGTKISDIKEIFSHPHAIAQCSQFLGQEMKDIKVTESENTAAAAKILAQTGRKDAAVIASGDCGDLYDLSTISHNIQNNKDNYTRFICISKTPQIFPAASKTSFTLALNHKPGSLYSLLTKLAAHNINISKLESRSISGQEFEFKFYIDIDTPIITNELKQVLAELEFETDMFSYLGTYQEI
ncbi:MAG: chorismate mutase [Oscillospiraceae bacterium]|nr:chorismate mutase [Oscillospiraceae bacterium]